MLLFRTVFNPALNLSCYKRTVQRVEIMDSTSSKQLAQAASQKQSQANAKVALLDNELHYVSDEDTAKKSGLKSKILSLRQSSQTYAAEASQHRSDAVRAEIKENDAAFKEIDKEQEEIRKAEAKEEQKTAKELEEKAKEKSLKNLDSDDLDKDFGDELLFLSDDNDFSSITATEDVIDFAVASPVQDKSSVGAVAGQPAKNGEEEELIKGATGASASST